MESVAIMMARNRHGGLNLNLMANNLMSEGESVVLVIY